MLDTENNETIRAAIKTYFLLCEAACENANFYFCGNCSLGTWVHADGFTFMPGGNTFFRLSCHRVEFLLQEMDQNRKVAPVTPSLLGTFVFWTTWLVTTVENQRCVRVLRQVMFMVTHSVHCVIVCNRLDSCFSAALKQRWGRAISLSLTFWHARVVWKLLSISCPLFPVV